MKSLFKRAIAALFFCALFCIHPVANAEEAKADSSAQSGVPAQGSKDQAQDAATKPAQTGESKNKATAEPEPECNN